jgi:hypothetical protein
MIAAIAPSQVPMPGRIVREGMALIHQDRHLQHRLRQLSRKERELTRRRLEMERMETPDPEEWEQLSREITGLHHQCEALGEQVEERVWERLEAEAQPDTRPRVAA